MGSDHDARAHRLDGLPSEPPALDVTVSQVAGTAVVAPSGDVDLATAQQLADAIGSCIEAGVLELEVRCSSVTFLDSAGVRVLVEGAEALRGRDGRLRVTQAPGAVERVLQVTGVWDLLTG